MILQPRGSAIMKGWMKALVVGSVGLLCLCLTQNALGQLSPLPDTHTGTSPVPAGMGRNNPIQDLRNLTVGGGTGPTHRESRVLSKGPLAPASEDRDAFRDFLRDKHSGLMRLMPREKYDFETYHVPRTIKIRGGGAYYSFAHLSHEYGYGSDIELERDNLSVGFAGADYGIMQNLGDVPLAEITLGDSRTSVLANYRAPTNEALARSARMRLGRGIIINGEFYQPKLPLVVNNTYLLRSINFGETDVLVAFRVIRKDQDGSATILWKLLKQSP